MSDTKETCPFGYGSGTDSPTVAGDYTHDGDVTDDGGRRVHPTSGSANAEWWPNRLNLKILAKNPAVANPLGTDFDYKDAFERLDFDALKSDLAEALTASQEGWPADFGHYGPFMVRMAWHSAGTYRSHYGRGGGGAGMQRFAPLNSWPEQWSARPRTARARGPSRRSTASRSRGPTSSCWPATSRWSRWASRRSASVGGCPDVWEADDDVYWGPEKVWLDAERYKGKRELDAPRRPTQMGLDLRQPRGPGRKSGSARGGAGRARDLPAHGHERRGDGRADRGRSHVRQDARRAPRRQAGPGSRGLTARGAGARLEAGLRRRPRRQRHRRQRPRGHLDLPPGRWGTNEFFHILFAYEWELFELLAAGAKQWRPKDNGGADMVPMAQGSERREPRMLTTDIALREDPIYNEISNRFRLDQAAFADAFARAWFKLTHRDMGPKSRYLGPEVPEEDLDGPLPEQTAATDADSIATAKRLIAELGPRFSSSSRPRGRRRPRSARPTSAAARTADASASSRR